MYDGIKKAISPVQKITSSIKLSTGVLLTEKNKQMEKLVERYSNLTLIRTLCIKPWMS